MKFSDLGNDIAKAFTNLIPNGDKVYDQFLTLDNMKGQYTINANGRYDDVYGFNITGTDASGNKTSTYVSIDQAKAGNWNPETNVLDTNQTFTIDDSGKVTSAPITTTPSTDDGTGSTTTPSTGTTGGTSDTDSVVIDFDQVDQYVENIDKSFKKINNSLNHVVSCFNSIEKLMKGNGLDNQINNIVKTCKKRYDYNSKKAAKLRTDINSDIYVILNQLMKSVQELQAAASKTEKDVSANSI